MQADDHLRIAIAEIVDDAVVKTSIARAGNERDIFQVEPAGHFRNDVAAPLHLRFAQTPWPVDLRFNGLPMIGLGHFPGGYRFHCLSCFFNLIIPRSLLRAYEPLADSVIAFLSPAYAARFFLTSTHGSVIFS